MIGWLFILCFFQFSTIVEYWFGLEKLHQVTKNGKWQLLLSFRFSKAGNQAGWIIYDNFQVLSEIMFYTLKLGARKNSQGIPNVNYQLNKHNNYPFTTRDRPNNRDAKLKCIHSDNGGWWYLDAPSCTYMCANCDKKIVHGRQENVKSMVLETEMAIRQVV